MTVDPGTDKTASADSFQKPWLRYQRAVFGLRNYWYPVLLSKKLKSKPVGIKLAGEELVLIRCKGRVYCLEGRCKHRGVPMSEGRLEFPCTISCAYHGWTYQLETGELVAALTDGPESAIVGKVKLQTYPVVEKNKVIWVFVGDWTPPPSLEEEMPEGFLTPGNVVGVRVHEGVGNWRLAIESALDPSHAAYLHRYAWLSFFRSMPAAKGKYTVEITEGKYLGYKTEGVLRQGDYPGLGRWPREGWWKKRSTRGANTKVVGYLPCAARVVGIPTNVPFTTYSWYVPVDKDHYRWVTFLVATARGLKKWRATLKYYLWLRWMYQGPHQFLGQDLRINELMHPFYAEQNGWVKERFYRPDVVITAWRKFVDETARGIQE
jgi:phenylpropionate dioxygenase-like ring-hydroxylating dioxygenase large terminal subunit